MLKTKIKDYFPLSCGIRLLGQLDAGKHSEWNNFTDQFDPPLRTPSENAEHVVTLVARKRWCWVPPDGVWRVEGFVGDRERFSTVIFSHRANDSYCNALVRYIRSNKLGRITMSPAVNNPNSGATIRTYVWDLSDKLQQYVIPKSKRK